MFLTHQLPVRPKEHKQIEHIGGQEAKKTTFTQKSEGRTKLTTRTKKSAIPDWPSRRRSLPLFADVFREDIKLLGDSPEKYWAEAMSEFVDESHTRGDGPRQRTGERRFFTKELRVVNVTADFLVNGNLTCRATNTPELPPVRTTLQLIKFCKWTMIMKRWGTKSDNLLTL